MDILEEARKQATVLRSYSALGSRDDSERYRAMTAMRECGASARWCLQLASRQTGQPRVQFAAAVVLHWLGDPQGLLTLTEALKWRLPSESALAPQLESAFVSVGSPDAVDALLAVWKMLPDWGDHELVRTVICRVWAALRNPAVLPALGDGALLCPDRFEQTVPAFGEMAISLLRTMTRGQDVRTRSLAVRTLQHIRSQNSFATLVPLLRDVYPDVRALVPSALERVCGRDSAIVEVSLAVRAGFPSADAISMLREMNSANLSDTLTEMFEVWSPTPGDRASHHIMILSVPALLENVTKPRRALQALSRLLHCRSEPQIALLLISSVEALAHKCTPSEPAASTSLAELLTALYPNVRREAAAALSRLGDGFPLQVIDFLDVGKPQDSFISQLQVILRGGRDAGQAATQAVQHVSKWWARLTSEAADPKSLADAQTVHTGLNLVRADPRLPAMLARMLAAVVHRSGAISSVEEADEKATLIVLLLRGLSRIGMPAASLAWTDIIAILHLPADALAVTGGAPTLKIQEAVAASVVETILELYGPDSFCLFLEALYSPRTEVVRTGLTALEVLGDSRAIPHLRSIAINVDHPCSATAAAAMAQIKRTNPEVMNLLRGSAATTSDPRTLLRAARGNHDPDAPAVLLRAAQNKAEGSHRR